MLYKYAFLVIIFAIIICCERKRKGAYPRRKTRDNWWCKNSVISYYTAILHRGLLPPTLTVFTNAFLGNNSSPSISLRASSPGCSGAGAGKGGRAYNYVFGIWIPPPISLRMATRRPSCQICANQREVETSANVNKLTLLTTRIIIS